MLVAGLLSALAACGAADGLACGPGTYEDDGLCLPLAASGDEDDGQLFTIRTRGVSPAYHFVSFTDATGPVACGLANGPQTELGLAGQQVIAKLVSYTTACRNESVSIRSGCTADFYDSYCAWHRTWDASGALSSNHAAIAGTTVVSDEGATCRYQVDLIFPGGRTFSDSFSVPNNNNQLKCLP